jgi:hypothetical protein
MRPLYRLLPLLLVATAPLTALADSGQGLSLQPDAVPWTRFNSRIAISAPSTPLRSDLSLAADAAPVRGLSLMGDYYLTGSLLGPSLGGGLRATSALLVGPRTQTLGAGSLGIAGGGRGLTIERRSPVTAGAPPDGEANTTLPYVGIGYTSLSARGGFAFSADLGVVALQPGSPVRLGRSPSNAASGDETLPRLSPMLQLGVSYSF